MKTSCQSFTKGKVTKFKVFTNDFAKSQQTFFGASHVYFCSSILLCSSDCIILAWLKFLCGDNSTSNLFCSIIVASHPLCIWGYNPSGPSCKPYRFSNTLDMASAFRFQSPHSLCHFSVNFPYRRLESFVDNPSKSYQRNFKKISLKLLGLEKLFSNSEKLLATFWKDTENPS